MDVLTAKLALSLAPGVGPETFRKILALDPHCHWAEQKSLRQQLPICIEARNFLSEIDISVIKILDWVAISGNQLICVDDPRYPALLKEIHDPPPFLYIQGNLNAVHEPQLGMVGCRNMSPYGQMLAFNFAKELAALGLSITSGLALGIDGMAHQGALAVEGITVAVLGTGLNKIYPAVHQKLSQEILEKKGALVSEFPPDAGIRREHFPRRNRVISGLSLGILVIEAAQKSGSLITAKYALEQNRAVFAIPGSIHSPQSRGCHQLLREGAILVERADDILTEIYQSLKSWKVPAQPPLGLDKHGNMNKKTLDLLSILRFNTPKSLDELALDSGLAHETLQKELLALELAGQIKRIPGGYVKQKDETAV